MQKNYLVAMALVCVLSCVAFVGCGKGDGLNPVTGTVTLDGAPLESGTINMGPMAGQDGTATGGKIENGTYSIRASEGEMVVSIRSKKTVKIDNPTEDEIAHNVTERTEEIIPEKYNQQSELKVTITKGKNTHDFALESK